MQLGNLDVLLDEASGRRWYRILTGAGLTYNHHFAGVHGVVALALTFRTLNRTFLRRSKTSPFARLTFSSLQRPQG